MKLTFITSIHPDFDVRVWKYATSMVQAGHEVRLICPWRVPSGTVRDGVTLLTFKRVQLRALRPLLIPLRLLPPIVKALADSDILHFHDIDILPWMSVISLIKPVIYDVHENYAEEMLVRDWIPKPLRPSLFWAVRLAHSIFPRIIHNAILVVPAQEPEFRAINSDFISIRNFASASLLSDCNDDHLLRPDRIVFTGAHYAENGSILLVDIARNLRDRGHVIQFLVTDRFASSAFETQFRRAIELYDLSDQFLIVPAKRPTELMQLLNLATIGIAPNLRVRKQELAIPTKLFEYMAAGLPIVTSDLPFQKRLIDEHHVGLLARPEDPDSFVDAILALVCNPPYARELGTNGQQVFLREFTWEAQMPSLISFYERILARGRTRSPKS